LRSRADPSLASVAGARTGSRGLHKGAAICAHFLSITWLIIRSLIEIGFVLLIFQRVADGFETIAIGCIGLVYTTVRSQGLSNAFTAYSMTDALDVEIRRLRLLLNDDQLGPKQEPGITLYVKVMIAGAATTVIALICILNMLGSL